jgi:hypothetical protein
MEARTILTRRLDNGLELECLDQSKQIATDRWYICIGVRITVPVEKKWFDKASLDENKFRSIRNTLGETVLFEQKRERNFISVKQKDQIIKEICDSIVDTALTYFGRDGFPAKLILKRYAEALRAY